MLDAKQPGKPTYQYLKIKSIFEGIEVIEQELRNIGNEVKSLLGEKIKFSIRKNIYQEDNLFLTIAVKDKSILMHIFFHLDGWTIEASKSGSNDLERNVKMKLFNDPNRSFIWTNETEKVPKMAIDFINGIIKARKEA